MLSSTFGSYRFDLSLLLVQLLEYLIPPSLQVTRRLDVLYGHPISRNHALLRQRFFIDLASASALFVQRGEVSSPDSLIAVEIVVAHDSRQCRLYSICLRCVTNLC